MTTDAAWDRGEGEDGEEIVFVETISTSRKGRALLFASAMFGGLVLGVGVVGAVWAGSKLLVTHGDFQRTTALVQEVNPDARDGKLARAARLDERDLVLAREYWEQRDRYDALCSQARGKGRMSDCSEWQWSNPPRLPPQVEARDRRRSVSPPP